MTIILAISQLTAAAQERPPGYVQEVMSSGKVDNERQTVELTREAYNELKMKYSGRAAGCCGE